MSCCAVGCKNRAADRKGVHFYRIPWPSDPFEEERSDRWIQAIRRLDLPGKKLYNLRLCSAHFITGKYSLDRNHPDFVPSIFSFTKPRDLKKGQERLKRYERNVERIERTTGRPYVPDTPLYTPEQRSLFKNNTAFNWPSIKKAPPSQTSYFAAVEENINKLKRGDFIPFMVHVRRPRQNSDTPQGTRTPKDSDVISASTTTTTKDNKNSNIRKPPGRSKALKKQNPVQTTKQSEPAKTNKTFSLKDGKPAPTEPVTPDKLPDARVDVEVRKDHAYAASQPKVDQSSVEIECYVCSRTVVGVNRFRSHMNGHLGIKEHVCPVCDKRFVHSSVLGRHKKVHSSEKPFSCSECGGRFKYKSSYRQHLASHSGVLYECEQCDKKFKHKVSFQAHSRVHEDHYRCPVCRRCFRSLITANEHFQLHVKEQEVRALSGLPSIQDFSSLTFELVESRASDFLCSECGMVLDKGSKRHRCREGLACPGCTLSFSSETERSRHVLKHHQDILPYRCHLCPRAFRRYLSLRLHHLRHTRPLLCEVCGKRCSHRDQLQVHARTHTGERPYHCPLCPKHFASSKSLRVHKKSHSTLLHSCPRCPRRFRHLQSLERHAQTHKRPSDQ